MMKNGVSDTSGMTLIEVVISLAIIAIGLTILLSGVIGAGNLFRHGTDLKNSGQQTAAEVEGSQTEGDGTGEVTFSVGSETFTVKGSYVEKKGTKEDVRFEIFIPNEKQN